MAQAGGYGDGPFSVTIPPFPDGLNPEVAHRNAQPDLRLLGLLNGRYLAAAFPLDQPGLALQQQEEGTWVYENELSLPRAYVAHQTEPVTNAQAWDQIGSFDAAGIALVEGGHRLNGSTEPSPARVVERAPNRLVVETELDAAGLLVLSEMWYPGWKARDNGLQAPILRTNAILRGVFLNAGQHTVEFDYDPWTVRAGSLLAGATTLVLAAALAACVVAPALRRKRQT